MIVNAYRTKIVTTGDSLFSVIETALPRLSEQSVIAVTSKIIAICQKHTKPLGNQDMKKKLIISEADLYLDDEIYNKYGILLTIKNGSLAVSAGIDESNGNGEYILWPKDPMESAYQLWNHFRKKYGLKKLGVVITDSRSAPLRWGVTGYAIGWCGFKPLKSYIGKPDLFGRPFHFVNTSVIDSMAATAVTVMGEGAEQTPLAVVSGAPGIEFTRARPTPEETGSLAISLEDDIYGPLLRNARWKKGPGGK